MLVELFHIKYQPHSFVSTMPRLFQRSRSQARNNARGRTTPALAPAPASYQATGTPALPTPTFSNNTSNSGVNLHDAASKGLEQTIQRLLDQGASINALDREGSTALQLAIRNGHERVVKLLLDRGADVDRPCGPLSKKPVYLASYSMNPTMMEIVLSHNPYLEFEGTGMTPLLAAVTAGDEDVVRLLLQAGANVGARTVKDGHSVLHLAVTYFKQSMLPLLVRSGADVNASSTDPPGLTALHVAAQVGNDDALRELIKAGANLFARYNGGLTALHGAAGNGRVSAASILIDHGLDVLDDSGFRSKHSTFGPRVTPIFVAVVRKRDRMLLFLLHKAASFLSEEMKMEMVTGAAGSGHLETLKILDRQGFHILGRDGFDETGLSMAAAFGHKDVAIFLLRKGADPSQRCRWNTDTPINIATREGHGDFVRLLQDAQRLRAQTPTGVLFPEWTGTRPTTISEHAEFKATVMSASATSTIYPNQDPGGSFHCYACRDLDFRRGMSDDANVVFFLPMPAVLSCGCRGCQFLQLCLLKIKNAYGEGLWHDKDTSAPTFPSINTWKDEPCAELTLQSMGQGMPLLLHADNWPSKTSRRIEIFVKPGTKV